MNMQMRAAPARPGLAVGDRIALLPHCPIDFEGVGPLPEWKAKSSTSLPCTTFGAASGCGSTALRTSG